MTDIALCCLVALTALAGCQRNTDVASSVRPETSAAGAPTSTEEPPPDERADDRPVTESDLADAKALLETFLEARWRGADTDPATLITRPDLELVDRRTWQAMRAKPTPGSDPIVRWEIAPLEATSDGGIRAVVELERPTPLSQLRSTRTIGVYREEKDGRVMAQRPILPNSIRLDREIVDVTYHLVREDDEWRVHMGWNRDSEHGPGSEPEHGNHARQMERVREKMRPPLALREKVEQAEELADLGQYPEAIRAYETLISGDAPPPFAADRLAQLKNDQRKWKKSLRVSGVDASLGRPLDHEEDPERRQLPLSVSNGRHALTVEIAVRRDDGSVVFREQFDLQAREGAERHVDVVDHEAGTEYEAAIRSVHFDVPKLRERFEPADTTEFKKQWKAWRDARHRVPTIVDDSRALRVHREAFHECGEWPAHYLDFVVEIDADGQGDLSDLRGGDVEPSMRECLAKKTTEIEFAPGFERGMAIAIYSSAFQFD